MITFYIKFRIHVNICVMDGTQCGRENIVKRGGPGGPSGGPNKGSLIKSEAPAYLDPRGALTPLRPPSPTFHTVTTNKLRGFPMSANIKRVRQELKLLQQAKVYWDKRKANANTPRSIAYCIRECFKIKEAILKRHSLLGVN